MTETLADTLERLRRESDSTLGQLARRAGLPKNTLVNWANGTVRKPRDWQALAKLAVALRLSGNEADDLLLAGGHKTVVELLARADVETDRRLLQPLLPSWGKSRSGPPPFQASAPPGYFVGREDMIRALKKALLSGHQVPMCVLIGMAGVGKTSLAAQLACDLRPYFPDGVLWAQLDSSNPMSILSTFADAYERDVSQYNDLDSRSTAVRGLLATKRTLIILDNAKTSRDVRPLLPPQGGCAVLITSRRSDLTITRGGRRFNVGPFDLEKSESMQLFGKLLGEDSLHQYGDDLLSIAELLGHLPLAVAIAAGRMEPQLGWSPRTFLGRLRLAKTRLEMLSDEDESVRLSFDLSYEELPEPLRLFFASLAVFGPNSFRAEAVAFICNTAMETAEDTLRELCRLSLLQNTREDRYHLHPLLCDYATERLGDAHVWERMVEYYVPEVSV